MRSSTAAGHPGPLGGPNDRADLGGWGGQSGEAAGHHPAGSRTGDSCRGTGSGGGQPRSIPQLALTVLSGGYACGAALGWGSERVALFMGDFGLSAAGLLAAVSCLWYARTCRGTQFRPAWALFGLSSLMAASGNAVWGWYELVLGEAVPRPSAADGCFLLFAPLAIIGLLVLAKRPSSRAGWVCLCLDSSLIGGSLLTLSWSLALAHTAYGQGGSVARVALTLAYPLLDIALVSMVLVLHLRRSGAQRSAVNLAIGALAVTVLCDALFTSPLLREHYSSGHFLDAGWFAGSLLLAYAPWAVRGEGSGRAGAAQRGTAAPTGRGASSRRVPDTLAQTTARRARAAMAAGAAAVAATPSEDRGLDGAGRPVSGSMAALAPYLAATVCTLSIIYSSLAGRAIDHVVLVTGSTVVLALVLRQGIMLLDNISLAQELAHKENHFRSLVQGSSDVIMIATPTGVLSYASPAAAGVFGRDGAQLVGAELSAFIHPEDLARVLHELRRFLAAAPQDEPSTRIECRFRHEAGHWLNVESTVNRYQGGLIFNSRDVTERVRLQAQLQHNASHDPLTDLPNRALFTERVRKALAGRRGGDSEHAVLYIDLDGFKAVNDTIGHQAGDELLVAAARRLQESVRAGDTAARLGGDEFAVLILGDKNPSTHADVERELRIHEIADRLRLTLSEPYWVEGTEARVAASIGIAFAEPGISPTALMRNADLAMYRAKQAGKARVELFAPQMQTPAASAAPTHERATASATAGASAGTAASAAADTDAAPAVPAGAPAQSAAAAVRRAESAVRTRGAPADEEFALLHQPVVELASGKVASVTAHLRWRSADGVLRSMAEAPSAAGGPAAASTAAEAKVPSTTAAGRGAPDRKPPAARPDADRLLLERAVEQGAARHLDGFHAPVTVRMPARRLTEDPSMAPSTLERLLAQRELPTGSLILELADVDPHTPLDALESRLTALRRLGVGVALDGFGDGCLAVSALRRLPVDILRLDRGLIEGVVRSTRERKITAGLLRIAGDLGLSSVADGVDVPEQALTLQQLGCTHGQGAVFSGPLDEHRLRCALSRGAYVLPEPRPEHGRPGSLIVAGPLPVRRHERREPLPPWLVAGDTREAHGGLPQPRMRSSHDETPVPPT